MIRRIWGAGLVGFVCASCSGQLFVRDTSCVSDADCKASERCVNGYCVPAELAQCTLDNLVGTCQDGGSCQCGVCTDAVYDCCNCQEDEGCIDGVCTKIPPTSLCGPSKPDGACRYGEVCVGGCCVPISSANGCGAERPAGLCPPGATCVAGVCLLVSELPCDSAHPAGRCPSGQSCTDSSCTIVACSPQEPFGACSCGGGHDEICLSGSCDRLPCSPTHPEGLCEVAGEFCSAGGRCIPNGTCLELEDCPYGAGFCSCPSAPTFGVCMNLGFCRCDEDCNAALSERCDIGTYLCVRDQGCSNNDDCLATEYCSTLQKCLAKGTCDVTADCLLSGANQYCSAGFVCLEVGKCDVDGDCDGGSFCSCAGETDRACVADGACVCSSDCPPAQSCVTGVCQVTGATCDFNAPAACVGTRWCCPTDKHCCDQGERCSLTAGRCIADGSCLEDADCPSSFTCSNFACVPGTTCLGPTCGAELTCSASGGCVPVGTCAVSQDCPAGEVCNAVWQCEPAAGCGSSVFGTTKVPPNMLIVLDRSGSMDWCIMHCNTRDDTDRATCEAGASGCVWSSWRHECNDPATCASTNPQRWATAVSAIAQVTWDQRDNVRFGLASFSPGTINDAVADNTRGSIMNKLCGDPCTAGPPCTCTGGTISPSGSTPTGPTLRNTIAASPGAAGLTSTDRKNYIMLVTDGDANSDSTDAVSVCSSICAANPCDSSGSTNSCCECRVNAGLDQLRALSPTVGGFVVGFGTGIAHPEYLNCYSVHGGTSRCLQPSACAALATQVTCEANLGCYWSVNSCRGGIDAASCDVTTPTCYYSAQNAASLTAAFQDIAGRIAGCAYSLSSVPPDSDLLFVYLDHQDGQNPERIERDLTHTTNWDYDTLANQVTIYGAQCDAVKSGLVVPVVILGCDTGGG
jgi:hypothetical protein